jgi:predicted tellurium resistance membrane protein TerC
VLIGGGLFLMAKATYEIHHSVEAGGATDAGENRPRGTFVGVIVQIALIDVVFSFDSVITAVGMAQHIEVMIAAIVISIGVMLVAAGPVSQFIERHPTLKMLALAFLILIGTMLVADGIGFHVPKGYIYFAMAFSCLVEFLNILVRRRTSAARTKRVPGSPGD